MFSFLESPSALQYETQKKTTLLLLVLNIWTCATRMQKMHLGTIYCKCLVRGYCFQAWTSNLSNHVAKSTREVCTLNLLSRNYDLVSGIKICLGLKVHGRDNDSHTSWTVNSSYAGDRCNILIAEIFAFIGHRLRKRCFLWQWRHASTTSLAHEHGCGSLKLANMVMPSSLCGRALFFRMVRSQGPTMKLLYVFRSSQTSSKGAMKHALEGYQRWWWNLVCWIMSPIEVQAWMLDE